MVVQLVVIAPGLYRLLHDHAERLKRHLRSRRGEKKSFNHLTMDAQTILKKKSSTASSAAWSWGDEVTELTSGSW